MSEWGYLNQQTLGVRDTISRLRVSALVTT